MKYKTKSFIVKATAIFLALAAITIMVMLAMKKIDNLTFWIVIAAIALFSFKGIKYMKTIMRIDEKMPDKKPRKTKHI